MSGLCLLLLAGGGVRGLSTLLVVEHLMERMNIERKNHGFPSVKLCELFYFIGGTSTDEYDYRRDTPYL